MKSLRELRTERLLSVRDLARLSGTTAKTIIQIELGRQTPTFRTMRRITDALQVNPQDVTEFSRAIDERSHD